MLQKRLYFMLNFFKKIMSSFLMLHFYSLFFSLFPFFYSNLIMINEVLSVTPLFMYDNIDDKKV